MVSLRLTSEKIRHFILTNVEKHPGNISSLTAAHFSITRQAVFKHLKALVAEKALIELGKTKNKIYKLAPLVQWTKTYKIIPGLAEDRVWREDISEKLGDLPDNVMRIWSYGFSEMFNNAIDHADASEIIIDLERDAVNTQLIIYDNGIGIFKKIQTSLNLLDEKEAVFELSKGKLTTDPKRHSGEGIFFSSRVFDSYEIISNSTSFSHQFGEVEDWVLDNYKVKKGTVICMKLNNHTARKTKDIFDEYSIKDDYSFSKTVVPVQLAQYENDYLVSRSQAKRILNRLEKFKVVIFDFESVESIGQAFADEIFRVFANQHPEMELLAINTTPEVGQMIRRAKAK